MPLDSIAALAPKTPPLTRARFSQLWRNCRIVSDKGQSCAPWGTLEQHYNENHRHYHNFAHIAHCLEQHDLAAGEMRAPEEVEMAIWFHDVIYETRALNNESRSADLFRRHGSDGFSTAFIDRVRGLILATIHDHPPQNPDQRFIVDIDLSSLGMPWHEFLRNSNAIRRENFDMSEDLYYTAIVAFLEALLRRPRIYLTDFFRGRYERNARSNIERYLGLVEKATI